MNERILTTNELSIILRVSKSTIKRWTDDGTLQCVRTPGGHRKFKLSDVRKFIIKYHYDVDSSKKIFYPNMSLLSVNDNVSPVEPLA